MHFTLSSLASATFLSSLIWSVNARVAFPIVPNFLARKDQLPEKRELCTMDQYLSVIEDPQYATDNIPFCSSLLGIPNETITIATITPRITVNPTVTSIFGVVVETFVVTPTVAATAYETNYVAKLKARKADAAAKAVMTPGPILSLLQGRIDRRQAPATSTSIMGVDEASSILFHISSACSCLHIPPSIIYTTATAATVTKTNQVIDYQKATSDLTVTTGTVTVTTTLNTTVHTGTASTSTETAGPSNSTSTDTSSPSTSTDTSSPSTSTDTSSPSTSTDTSSPSTSTDTSSPSTSTDTSSPSTSTDTSSPSTSTDTSSPSTSTDTSSPSTSTDTSSPSTSTDTSSPSTSTSPPSTSTESTPTEAVSSPTSSTASPTSTSDPRDGCPATNGTIITEGGCHQYQLQCGIDYPMGDSYDLTFFTDTIEDCINICENANAGVATPCVGISFLPDEVPGSVNCYIRESLMSPDYDPSYEVVSAILLNPNATCSSTTSFAMPSTTAPYSNSSTSASASQTPSMSYNSTTTASMTPSISSNSTSTPSMTITVSYNSTTTESTPSMTPTFSYNSTTTYTAPSMTPTISYNSTMTSIDNRTESTTTSCPACVPFTFTASQDTITIYGNTTTVTVTEIPSTTDDGAAMTTM